MKSSKMLRIRDVARIIGLSRSTIYNKMSPSSRYFDLSFPRPIKLGKSAIGWIEEEIFQWLEFKILDRDSIV